MAYYEVFHESLATLKAGDVHGRTPDAWASKHPAGAPYLSEYIPLLDEEGGVRGYDPAMAYERFLPQDGIGGELTAGEIGYVAGLIEHAQALGKIPVLTATRSLGRVQSLKSAFGGRHILNYRNSFHQWASFCEQEWLGGSYFFHVLKLQLQFGAHDATIRRLVDVFGVEEFDGRRPRTFFLVAGLHLYLYGRAASHVDLILDLERLAGDPAHRMEVERRISAWGVDVDLSQARRCFAFSLCDLGPRHDVVGWLRALEDILLSSDMDAQGRTLVTKALGEIESEITSFDFYAGPLRRSLMARVEAVSEDAARGREHAEALAARIEEQTSALARLEARLGELEASLEAEGRRAGELGAELHETRSHAGQLETLLSAQAARADELARLRDDLEAQVQAFNALHARPLVRRILDQLGPRRGP
jgi:hypothetical protein